MKYKILFSAIFFVCSFNLHANTSAYHKNDMPDAYHSKVTPNGKKNMMCTLKGEC